MTIEKLKQEINEIMQSLKITEDNKYFFREHIITVLGEKYCTRATNGEELFGQFVDEAIAERINGVKLDSTRHK